MAEIGWYISAVILILLVLLYRRKFYRPRIQSQQIDLPTKLTDNPLPSVVSGWFFVCHSEELSVAGVQHFKAEGEHIAIFRGTDRVVYGIDAYCGHLGANLAEGGRVKGSCLECPFHGWLYNGKNGSCVNHDGTNKLVNSYQYLSKEDGITIAAEGDKHTTSNRTFLTHQSAGFVYVWIDAKNQSPTYFPLDFSEEKRGYVYKGITINHICSRPQDLPENGADFMHFNLVHNELISGCNSLFRPIWTANWEKASEVNSQEVKHRLPHVAAHKRRILEKFLKGQDLEKIGVIDLELELKLLARWKVFTFNITGFQVGPGLVYLFFRLPFFDMAYLQYVTHPSSQRISMAHELFAPWWLPDLVSYGILSLEYQQVDNDSLIWSHKKQYRRFQLNPQNSDDRALLRWRNWYLQFFRGAEHKLERVSHDW